MSKQQSRNKGETKEKVSTAETVINLTINNYYSTETQTTKAEKVIQTISIICGVVGAVATIIGTVVTLIG